ncbi:MAG TPA: hypothetical protein VHH36_06480, partial [Candidatus Thermoplasmatota archaeon]|nr:hypothetical protein [Candidatus Thermoplasmatota archaeon]
MAATKRREPLVRPATSGDRMGALRAFVVTLILIAITSTVFFNLAQPPADVAESTAPAGGGSGQTQAGGNATNATGNETAAGTPGSAANATQAQNETT